MVEIVLVDPSTRSWEIRQPNAGTLLLRWVHPLSACIGRECVIHTPTDHDMRDWPLYWRDDRSIFERICSHGVGHPDPDQGAYWAENGMLSEWVHGCDGCCMKRSA